MEVTFVNGKFFLAPVRSSSGRFQNFAQCLNSFAADCRTVARDGLSLGFSLSRGQPRSQALSPHADLYENEKGRGGIEQLNYKIPPADMTLVGQRRLGHGLLAWPCVCVCVVLVRPHVVPLYAARLLSPPHPHPFPTITPTLLPHLTNPPTDNDSDFRMCATNNR